jgi:hypothetical protein
MNTPVIINPDPEPDIEGDIRNYSHLNKQQQQSQQPQSLPQQYTRPIGPQHVFNEKDYAFNRHNGGQLAVVPVESIISASSEPSKGDHDTSILNPRSPAVEGTWAKQAEAGIDNGRSPRLPVNGAGNYQTAQSSDANAIEANHGGEHDNDDPDAEEEDEYNPHITWGACFKVSLWRRSFAFHRCTLPYPPVSQVRYSR